MRSAGFVALVALAVYLGSFRSIVTIDGVTNVLVAYRIAQAGDVDLTPFASDYNRLSFWAVGSVTRPVSIFPPGAPFFAVPFAALGVLMGIYPPQTAAITIVGKAAAATATAASVFLVSLLAARVGGRRIAMIVAILYAFATATWPVSAGQLWQHGVAQLFMALGLLWLLPAPHSGRWAPRSGLPFALAALVRPSNAIVALASFVYLLRERGRRGALWAVWTIAPAILLLCYNLAAFGSPVAYSYVVPAQGNFIVGALGQLFAPSRGLFVYSPFLLLGTLELGRYCVGSGRLAAFLRYQSAGALGIFVLYAWYVEWWGGYVYGNRLLSELLPLLAIGLALWLRRWRRSPAALWLLGLTSVPAVVFSVLGALFYDWQEWSWESASGVGLDELVWRVDMPQWLHAAMHVGERLDVISAASLAIVCLGWSVLAYAFVRSYGR